MIQYSEREAFQGLFLPHRSCLLFSQAPYSLRYYKFRCIRNMIIELGNFINSCNADIASHNYMFSCIIDNARELLLESYHFNREGTIDLFWVV